MKPKEAYKRGIVKDAVTEIDKEWRKDTRPKKLKRTKSEPKFVKSELESEKSSYDTESYSSFASIDY